MDPGKTLPKVKWARDKQIVHNKQTFMFTTEQSRMQIVVEQPSNNGKWRHEYVENA